MPVSQEVTGILHKTFVNKVKLTTLDANIASVMAAIPSDGFHLGFLSASTSCWVFFLKFVPQVLFKKNMTPAAAELAGMKDKLVKMELDHIAVSTSHEKECVL